MATKVFTLRVHGGVARWFSWFCVLCPVACMFLSSRRCLSLRYFFSHNPTVQRCLSGLSVCRCLVLPGCSGSLAGLSCVRSTVNRVCDSFFCMIRSQPFLMGGLLHPTGLACLSDGPVQTWEDPRLGSLYPRELFSIWLSVAVRCVCVCVGLCACVFLGFVCFCVFVCPPLLFCFFCWSLVCLGLVSVPVFSVVASVSSRLSRGSRPASSLGVRAYS